MSLFHFFKTEIRLLKTFGKEKENASGTQQMFKLALCNAKSPNCSKQPSQHSLHQASFRSTLFELRIETLSASIEKYYAK